MEVAECVEHVYDDDGYCKTCLKDKPCDHEYNRHGHCFTCGEARLCVLCEKEPFTSACDLCEDGTRLCDNCYTSCDDCCLRCCLVCDQEGRHECENKNDVVKDAVKGKNKKRKRDQEMTKTCAKENYLKSVAKENGFVFAKISPIDLYMSRYDPHISSEYISKLESSGPKNAIATMDEIEMIELAKSRRNDQCKTVLCQVLVNELPTDDAQYYKLKLGAATTISYLSRPNEPTDSEIDALVHKLRHGGHCSDLGKKQDRRLKRVANQLYFTEWCQSRKNVLEAHCPFTFPIYMFTPRHHQKYPRNEKFEWSAQIRLEMFLSGHHAPIGKLTLLIEETQRYHAIKSLFATFPRFILLELWPLVLEFQL